MLLLANGALAFVVEMALLAGVGRAALLRLDAGVAGWLAAFLAVGLVALVWGLWAAPSSAQRLEVPALLALKAGVFLLGALAWWSSGPAWAGPVFAGAATLSLTLGLATRL